MKKFPVLAIILALLAVVTACKTSEKNYRSAYETAVGHQKENSGVDSTIYARFRNAAHRTALVSGSDSIPMQTEYVGYPKDGGASRDSVLRYNIVVSQFKQIFNAKAMRTRLLSAGYPHAMIVNTREPLYYVIAETCSTPEEAAGAWRRVKADRSMMLKEGFPFILQVARYGR